MKITLRYIFAFTLTLIGVGICGDRGDQSGIEFLQLERSLATPKRITNPRIQESKNPRPDSSFSSGLLARQPSV